ncbi:MAG: hypothetical protein AAFV07_11920, partial [Bacteroidota bacterium]
FGIFVGGATAGVLSLAPPKPKTERMRVPEKFTQNPEFAEGYKQGMKRKKARKALHGFLAGLGTQIVFIGGFLLVVFR